MIRVEYIQSTRADIWLSRPAARNALTFSMLRALEAACHELSQHTALQVVVLRAEGPVFCAGGDLAEVATTLRPGGAAALHACGSAALSAFAALPCPTVASLFGPAIGGGAELALAADFRLAGPRAALEFRHVQLGTTPAWGSVARLLATTNSHTTRRLLLRGEPLGAGELAARGLADLARKGLGEAAALDAYLAALLAQEPGALRAAKQLLHTASIGGDLQTLEAQALHATWGSPAHQARVTAAQNRARAEK